MPCVVLYCPPPIVSLLEDPARRHTSEISPPPKLPSPGTKFNITALPQACPQHHGYADPAHEQYHVLIYANSFASPAMVKLSQSLNPTQANVRPCRCLSPPRTSSTPTRPIPNNRTRQPPKEPQLLLRLQHSQARRRTLSCSRSSQSVGKVAAVRQRADAHARRLKSG